jgi:hypothetical protein
MISGDHDDIGQIPTDFFREALSLALEAVQARTLAPQQVSSRTQVQPVERAATRTAPGKGRA